MTADLSFVAGICLAAYAVVSFLKAHAEGYPPRVAFVLLGLAIALVALAEFRSGWAYSITDVPMVVVRVVGDVLN